MYLLIIAKNCSTMKNKNITKSRKRYLAYSSKYLLILFAIFASIQIIAQTPEKNKLSSCC
jgi:hypothetical protein